MFVRTFEKHWNTHPIKLSFFAGLLFVTVAQVVSYFLFQSQPHLIGLTTIFFTVLFAMPVFTYLISAEETLEKKNLSFFKKQHAVIDYHLYFFLGVLLVFFIVSLIQPAYVFDLSNFLNLEQTTDMTNDPQSRFSVAYDFISIVENNLFIILCSLILRLFFGSGGIFLLVLNASISASLIATFLDSSPSEFVCQVSLFQIYFIPEIIGLILAAIAGGVFYMDVVKEKFWSKSFIKVGIDSVVLLLVSVFFIISAAALEVYVAKDLFSSNLCDANPFAPIFILFIAIGLIIVLERKRQKHKKHYLRTKQKISAFRK